ncbi:MAG: hypothetical protein COV44_06760 [Deltaproteobacteria bacterium CG11_big_fil_rev_8_21_14_0_20_45_16]|nr:MAG: hypothetical protein COV44_06760 [Deltaproteobacteria bacterium CG11_big_fil_rev_8_21_14_0_20_45_16]
MLVVHFFSLLVFSHFYVAQADEAAPPPEDKEFTTNSGEEFRDPFADPDLPGDEMREPLDEAPDEMPGGQDSGIEPKILDEGPTEGMSPGSSPSETPTAAPVVEPDVNQPGSLPEIRSPSDEFEFPTDEVGGAISEDLLAKEVGKSGSLVGGWNYMLDAGAGFNFNRRPAQVHLEMEGGYRLLKQIEINAILYYRFISQRNLGLLIVPSWILPLSTSKNRIDLRLGVGTGWVLTGVRGNDFQLGLFPVRASGSLFFYALPRFALVLSTDVEMYMFQVDTDSNAKNFLDDKKGPPSQLITTAGIRFEF